MLYALSPSNRLSTLLTFPQILTSLQLAGEGVGPEQMYLWYPLQRARALSASFECLRHLLVNDVRNQPLTCRLLRQ